MKNSKLFKLMIAVVISVSMMATPALAFAEVADSSQQVQQQDPQDQPDPEPPEPIQTTIAGLPKTKTQKSRSTLSVIIAITAPAARTLYIEQYLNKKWKTKKKIQTADTTDVQQLKVKFPNTWWKTDKTKWRLRLDASEKATAFTTQTMTLKTKRYYQNPKKYIQIKNKISKHGKHYWTYPVKVNNASTRKDHVDAMIKAAKKYLGDPYVVCRSGKPGKGVDCSGLVMQACYAAGADLWPSNPYRHRFPKYEYESRRIARMKNLKTVSYRHAKRGDLIFYSKGGIVIHIAIYLGHGRIIHSWPGHVQISSATNPRWGHLCKVKRVFVK